MDTYTPDCLAEDQQVVTQCAAELFEQLSVDAQNALLELMRTIVEKN